MICFKKYVIFSSLKSWNALERFCAGNVSPIFLNVTALASIMRNLQYTEAQCR